MTRLCWNYPKKVRGWNFGGRQVGQKLLKKVSIDSFGLWFYFLERARPMPYPYQKRLMGRPYLADSWNPDSLPSFFFFAFMQSLFSVSNVISPRDAVEIWSDGNER